MHSSFLGPLRAFRRAVLGEGDADSVDAFLVYGGRRSQEWSDCRVLAWSAVGQVDRARP